MFNTPSFLKENTYVGRVDFNLTSRHKFFARGTWDRDNNTQITAQFPGDPAGLIGNISHNRSFVVGYTWTISNTLVNNIFAGPNSRNLVDFPALFAPTAPTLFLFGLNEDLSNPYGSFSSQARNVAVPEVREALYWSKGRHTMEFLCSDIKPIREYSKLANSINNAIMGIGGNINQLNPSLRPADINPAQSAINEYDGLFPVVLGRYASTSTNFNYDVPGNPLPLGSAAIRHIAYDEFEFYAQDTFYSTGLNDHLRFALTLPRRSLQSNGFESILNVDKQTLLNARQMAAAQGLTATLLLRL